MSAPSSILLRNARLFDGERVDPRDRIDVLIEAERIKEVSDTPIRTAAALEIDARGRTLMPGLIDAHVHVYGETDPALAMSLSYNALFAARMLEHALECGFTTVRDVGGGDLAIDLALKRGLIRGPRFYYAGRMLSMTGGHADPRPRHQVDGSACSCRFIDHFHHVVDGADACRRAAREELRRGAHCVKFTGSGGITSPTDPLWIEQYTAPEIAAIVEECARRRTYAAAHCYDGPNALRCAEIGVRTIEHGMLIDSNAAMRIAGLGAYVIPTLIIVQGLLENGREIGLSGEQQAKVKEVHEKGLHGLENLHAAGVRMGFGTDLIGPLYKQQAREFLLRREVLPAIEILRSATSISADAMMLGHEIGRIRPGALADLIVVDGDPLADISLLAQDGRCLPLIMCGGKLHRNRLQ